MIVVGVVLYIFDLRSRKPGEEPEPVVQPETDVCTDDCCSTHDVCPSEMLLSGAIEHDKFHSYGFAGIILLQF